MKRAIIYLVLLGMIYGVRFAEAGSSVQPVFADGWVVAGNRTVGRAVRYMRVGMWDEAQAELHRMVGYRPRNHAAQFNLGVCYERMGRPDTARRFYERAIELRPELLYCESLARLEGVAGKGAEFVKFLIPCGSECNHGYAFARAGLWQYAVNRFEASLSSRSSPVTAQNLAVSYEVIGMRSKANEMIRRASGLSYDERHQEFADYLARAPELPLEMLKNLPYLTTSTDLPVIASNFISRNNSVVRMARAHDSVVLAVLNRNTRVDVLDCSSSWVRIRIHQNREGYIPAVFLSDNYLAEEEEIVAYSVPHLELEPSLDVSEEETMLLEPDDWEYFVVTSVSENQSITVRAEPSLMSDVVGHIEPETVFEVIQTDYDSWFEIVSPLIQQGYILKMHVIEVDSWQD